MAQSEYFREWYLKNKSRIAAKRARLYKEDSNYRKRAIENSFKQRAKAKVERPKGYIVTLTQALGRLQISVAKFREWKRKGMLPQPLQFQGRILFTENQMVLLHSIEVHFANYGMRDQAWNRGRLESLVDFVHANWDL